MFEWLIIVVLAYSFGYWWRGSNVLALLAEKKAIRAESRRLRAMYEAAKGDLKDSLRSHSELADEFFGVCKELKEVQDDI